MEQAKFNQRLIELGACQDARKWAKGKTPRQAWEQCERGDWLLWWATKEQAEVRQLTLAKARVVKLVLTLIKVDRGVLAVEAAEKFGQGLSDLEEVNAACAAFRAAADAAAEAAAAAACAADDAGCAGAAADAAAAAACATAEAAAAAAAFHAAATCARATAEAAAAAFRAADDAFHAGAAAGAAAACACAADAAADAFHACAAAASVCDDAFHAGAASSAACADIVRQTITPDFL